MTIFKAILFVLANFAFLFSLCHIFAAATAAICNTIAKVNAPSRGGYASLIAALSFTFIMTYLFIW